MKKQKILKCCAVIAVFIVGLVGLLALASWVLYPRANDENIKQNTSLINYYMGEKKNSVDVVFIGDSEVFSAYSPMKLWEDHGYTAFDFSTVGQPLFWSEKYLHQAFDGQSPKVVFLEAGAAFRQIKTKALILDKIKDIFPVFRYHDRWKNFKFGDIFKEPDYTKTDYMKGFYYNSTAVAAGTAGYMSKTDASKEIIERNKTTLKNMKQYCEDHGAELVFIGTPSTKNWNMEKHNGVQKFADDNDIKFIDLNLMNDKTGIDWSKDTRDRGDHLNFNGAMKVTGFMGRYIEENYQLTDHRGDKDYENWDRALVRYKKRVS